MIRMLAYRLWSDMSFSHFCCSSSSSETSRARACNRTRDSSGFSSVSSARIFDSRAEMLRYSFFSCMANALFLGSSRGSPSKRAEEAEEASVVPEERVKEEEAME